MLYFSYTRTLFGLELKVRGLELGLGLGLRLGLSGEDYHITGVRRVLELYVSVYRVD